MVKQTDVLGSNFRRDTRKIGARQSHEGLCLGARRHDPQTLLPGEVHHRSILDKTVHEQNTHTPDTGPRCTPFKQRLANPLSAAFRQNGYPQLSMILLAGEMSRSHNHKFVVGRDEYGITREINAVGVLAYTVVGENLSKSQAAIFRIKSQQMSEEPRTLLRNEFSRCDPQMQWLLRSSRIQDARLSASAGTSGPRRMSRQSLVIRPSPTGKPVPDGE